MSWILFDDELQTRVRTADGETIDTLYLTTGMGPKGDQGDVGPVGSSGLSGGFYLHNQTIASTVWLVEHDLPYEPGGVSVLDDAGLQHYPVMTYQSAGVVRLNFLVAVSGKARVS